MTRKLINEEKNNDLYTRAKQLVTESFESALKSEPTTMADVINNVYHLKTPQLKDQLSSL